MLFPKDPLALSRFLRPHQVSGAAAGAGGSKSSRRSPGRRLNSAVKPD